MRQDIIMEEFWIFPDSDYARFCQSRVAQGPEYAWIWLYGLQQGAEYAWISLSMP